GVSWRGYAAGDLLLRRGAAASERGAAPRTPGGGMGRRGCCLPVHARELQPHRFADDQLTAGRVSRLRAAVDGLPPAEECAVRACRLGSGCLDVHLHRGSAADPGPGAVCAVLGCPAEADLERSRAGALGWRLRPGLS